MDKEWIWQREKVVEGVGGVDKGETPVGMQCMKEEYVQNKYFLNFSTKLSTKQTQTMGRGTHLRVVHGEGLYLLGDATSIYRDLLRELML